MTKQELAELIVAPHQDIKMWLRHTKRELELILEFRTAPTTEARKIAQDELQTIRTAKWRKTAEREKGIIAKPRRRMK